LLFIQPDDGGGSIFSEINSYLFTTGNTAFYGFDGGSGPIGLGTFVPTTDIVNWMSMYATSGVTGLPTVRQLTLTSNLLDEFNIPAGTVPASGIYGNGNASHVILVPTVTLVGYEKKINQGNASPPTTVLNMDSSIYYNGGNAIINYNGPVYYNGNYRMYYVGPNMGGLSTSNAWYYSGNEYSLTP